MINKINMKTFKSIGMAILAIGIYTNFISCSDDGKESPIPNHPSIEEFTQSDMNFTEKANEQTFTFTTNADWTISVAPTKGGENWCTASPTQGNAGNQTVKIAVVENSTYDDRSVTVTLKSGTESKSFVVTQKQKDALLLTSDKVEINQMGGDFTIEVKTNINYIATIGEECKDWIKEKSNTRTLSTTTRTYSAAVNENNEKREGTITFTDGILSETVHIYQAGGDIILLSKNEYNVDAAGEDITVELRSNCEYEVEMPQVDWIHEISTRAMSSHTLYYSIDANTTYDSREAKIIYRNKKNDVMETLTIIQAQKDAIILGQKEVTVNADGETIEVKLSANVDYEVEMPDVDWITTTTTRGLTEHTLYYNVAKNEGDDSRSAKITFTNKESGVEDILLVSQKGKMPDIITINVPNAGDLPKITERADFKALKLVGYLNGTDISAIRKMKYLEYLDISEAHIVSGESTYQISSHPYYGEYRTEDNRIGSFMFFEFKYLKQIILPNSIIAIGRGAFLRCTNLSIIEIPNSVTMIGNEAFSGCANLKNINIPNGVTVIGSSAFSGCKRLTDIDIPNGISIIEDYTFSGCASLLNIKIPNSVTTIELGAFKTCNSLKNINIPNSVATIGYGAFQNCTSLTDINISNGVTTIGEQAFYECTSLASINIPNSVTIIKAYAFYGCTNLGVVKIGTGVTDIGLTYLLENPSITEVYCFAMTPPKSYNYDFTGIVKSEAKLYIPKDTYQAYYLSNWGAAFDNIIEMED